jgi:hypothetical protein
LFDTGKEMMADSIEANRNLCKFMIGTSTSAIPIYLGILTFIFPVFGKRRDKIIDFRKWSIWVGMLFFVVSIVWGIVSISINRLYRK